MTKVACAQLAPRVGELEANVVMSMDAVRHCLSTGADIVVLPELVTSGYVFREREEATAVAITAAHPVFTDWAEQAGASTDGSAVVVGGFCEDGGNGRLYNSAAVVDASGVRAVYRKAHLWDREKLYFTPGDALPPVIDTAHGRIGVLICYDLEFPEWTRTLALAGAELVTCPTNWPLVERPDGERAPEVIIAMAAARVNRMAIACCDRTGTERGQEWTAGTTIIGADGWVLAETGAHVAVSADIDMTASRDKALTSLAHLIDDRRPGLYGQLSRP